MRPTTTAALLALAFVLAPLAGAESDPWGDVHGFTPGPGSRVAAGCSGAGAGGCSGDVGAFEGAWEVWVSTCTNDAVASSCSDFTGSLQVDLDDNVGNHNRVQADFAKGAFLVFVWTASSNTRALCTAAECAPRLTVTPLPLQQAVLGVGTPVGPMGGAFHAWVTWA